MNAVKIYFLGEGDHEDHKSNLCLMMGPGTEKAMER